MLKQCINWGVVAIASSIIGLQLAARLIGGLLDRNANCQSHVCKNSSAFHLGGVVVHCTDSASLVAYCRDRLFCFVFITSLKNGLLPNQAQRTATIFSFIHELPDRLTDISHPWFCSNSNKQIVKHPIPGGILLNVQEKQCSFPGYQAFLLNQSP